MQTVVSEMTAATFTASAVNSTSAVTASSSSASAVAAGGCSGCPERVVCRCLRVTEAKVLDALSSRAICSVKELRSCTGAGDGCMACHRLLQRYIERHGQRQTADRPAPATPVAADVAMSFAV
jgi:bacterioferritin-associated ferredoxin